MQTQDTVAPPNLSALASTPLVDSDHPAVQAFARQHAQGSTARERAVSLFFAARDSIRYDPYRIDLSVPGMRASSALTLGHGWCVTKAALLAAACRAAGIPARLGFADVRNHLSTERLRQTLQTDIFIWHGYTDIHLEGRWVKATPAFNIELCDRFGLLPLDFDGLEDSVYHPFDRAGNRHMEYVLHRGTFDDVPLAQIVADFQVVYPALQPAKGPLAQADFLSDVAREQP